MYRLYGKNKNYEYELIKIVHSIEQAQEIINNNTKYINILVIKREHNTDEVICMEKPKVLRKKIWLKNILICYYYN